MAFNIYEDGEKLTSQSRLSISSSQHVSISICLTCFLYQSFASLTYHSLLIISAPLSLVRHLVFQLDFCLASSRHVLLSTHNSQGDFSQATKFQTARQHSSRTTNRTIQLNTNLPLLLYITFYSTQLSNQVNSSAYCLIAFLLSIFLSGSCRFPFIHISHFCTSTTCISVHIM